LLLAWAGGEPWLIATYTALMAVITIVATYLTSETFQEDIAAERPEERGAVAGEPA
jgi:LPS O-antigen subunit length determinant protein (WzzB/FepE family)